LTELAAFALKHTDALKELRHVYKLELHDFGEEAKDKRIWRIDFKKKGGFELTSERSLTD
jgi:hypothetical protein